ncbi:MAG: hypothetical protein HUU47_04575 [Bacteroidetes bacterium]|nr:hypothetical protein [Bacteroidota bacterium]
MYDGSLPFRHFFKNYCIKNKSLGSKDRKIIKEIFYLAFRSGKYSTFDDQNLFMLANNLNSCNLLKDFFNGIPYNIEKSEFVFPFPELINEQFNNKKYFESYAVKPLIWVRINKNKKYDCIFKTGILPLEKVQINENTSSWGFENLNVSENEKYFEIQDLSSQIAASKIKIHSGENVWDCCSGAGGKSLFIAENFKNFNLFVSDKRSSVLSNLKNRFKKNKLNTPFCSTINIENNIEKLIFDNKQIGFDFFDVIIADVPCSGSGTWVREPENLYFFDKHKINFFAEKQYLIVKNSLKFLKPNGKFYYITCSIFDEENFNVIKKLENDKIIEIVNYDYIKGFENRADNMFWAEISKKN